MKKYSIGTGVDDFREIREENKYYIDKTLFIEEIVNSGAKVTLITRPRRFGKTLNMSTLRYFFDIDDKEKNRELFKELNIEKTDCMSEQGKYPVIYLTMKELGGEKYSEFFMKFKSLMRILFNNYYYLRIKLNESDQMYFDRVWLEKKGTDYSRALSFLSEQLYKHHGIKPVILIDEYDAPMMASVENGYYEKVRDLIGSFYGNALKGGCSSYAVVTGVLKIAKESIFSTLNNLEVSTILTGDYNHFGMSEAEVMEALKYYEWETTLKETKEWYNGYLFGKERIYNPWSIMHHCKAGELKAFWIGTSANLLIKNLIKESDNQLSEMLYNLMKGERIKVYLDDNMIFGENFSNSSILYLMLSSGYLTIDERGEERNEYYLTIPNYEVKEYFGKTFAEIATNEKKDSIIVLKDASGKRIKLYTK